MIKENVWLKPKKRQSNTEIGIQMEGEKTLRLIQQKIWLKEGNRETYSDFRKYTQIGGKRTKAK